MLTDAAPMLAPALFLDRDDTLVYDEGYMSRPEQIRLLPGVADALQRAFAEGFRLYLVTNQSGIGRGYYTLADAQACNARLSELLFGTLTPATDAPHFAGICIAPERPEQPSLYRKPSPAYVLEKLASDALDPARCYLIGDKESDLQCGLNAHIHAILVARGASGLYRPAAAALAQANALPCFPDLTAALASILRPAPAPTNSVE